MTFLSLNTALIAAAVAVPTLFILYFLKLRRRDLEVSSTLLWKKAIEDLQANAPFQKLRNNILLILQLLALLAGLFALAQPVITSRSLEGKRQIIMIDRSASMRSTDGDEKDPASKRTRLEVAKQRALEVVASLAEPGLLDTEGDRAMVIAFDTRADIIQTFTDSKAELRRAIESIQPTDNPTRFDEAFRLARAHLPKRKQLEDGNVTLHDELTEGGVAVQLFSDGRLPDIDKLRLQNDTGNRDELTYHLMGDPKSWNIGIITMRAERQYDRPEKASVFISLQSTSTTPRSVDVQLSVEGNVVAIKNVAFQAAKTKQVPFVTDKGEQLETVVEPESRGVVFEIERRDAAVLVATLIHPEPTSTAGAGPDRGDVLKTDDLGYLALPPARQLTVAAVTDGNLWLRIGLEGMRLSRPAKLIAPSAAQVFLDSPEAAEYDVVILDRWLPTITDDKGKSVQGLPPGRWLIIGAAPPPPMGLDDLGPGKSGVALNWKRDHAILRGVQLDDLTFPESRTTEIKPGSPMISLADGPSGPLIVEGSDLTRRAVIVTFNPLVSNWPLKPGSLIFLAKALDYLARDATDTAALSATPGQTITQRLPRGSSGVSLTPPEGNNAKVTLVAQPSGEIVYGPIKSVGIYTLTWDGQPAGGDTVVNGTPRRAISVNLADPFESDITPRSILSTASRVVSAEAQSESGTLRRLWPWLLLGMLGVLVLEWWVYNRKVAL
ncbi:MAG: VWA domain-containing protein [Phycisphaerales bacterium]|nr:VWA domain-containing protein [Phycisphaerales bacterium]